jgi:protein SCO1/2
MACGHPNDNALPISNSLKLINRYIDITLEEKNRMNLKLIRFGILGISLGLGGLAIATYFIRSAPKTFVQDSAQDSESCLPELGGPFRLIDQFGNTRTDKEFRGKYQLIYFGYSYCADICPLGLQNISAALKRLGTDLSHFVPIFITIDPKRDDVENLSLYAQNWHSSFIFLTGTPQQLAPVFKAYKVYASKVNPQETTREDYVMDHSTLIYLMDREGKLIDFFPHSTPSDKIFEKLQKHLISEIKTGKNSS